MKRLRVLISKPHFPEAELIEEELFRRGCVTGFTDCTFEQADNGGGKWDILLFSYDGFSPAEAAAIISKSVVPGGFCFAAGVSDSGSGAYPLLTGERMLICRPVTAEVFCDAIQQLFSDSFAMISDRRDLSGRAARLLVLTGYNMRSSGFGPLRDCICFTAGCGCGESLLQGAYSYSARLNGMKQKAVERSIRLSAGKLWKTISPAVFSELFPGKELDREKPLSNRIVIDSLSDYINNHTPEETEQRFAALR